MKKIKSNWNTFKKDNSIKYNLKWINYYKKMNKTSSSNNLLGMRKTLDNESTGDLKKL